MLTQRKGYKIVVAHFYDDGVAAFEAEMWLHKGFDDNGPVPPRATNGMGWVATWDRTPLPRSFYYLSVEGSGATFGLGNHEYKTFDEAANALHAFEDLARHAPQMAGVHRGEAFWFYQGRFYAADDEDLTAEDVAVLVTAAQQKRERQLARARAAVATADVPNQRQAISDDVKMFVWQRDGGRCVRCESNENLEFDHIIPISMGGANTARNLQILCEACNRSKGGNLV